jgi:hypothetical protein
MIQEYFHEIFRLIHVDMDNLLNDDMNLYRNNRNIHEYLNTIHLDFDKYHQDIYFDIFQTIKTKI